MILNGKDFNLKNELERINELLHPYILLCHPDKKETIEKILADNKDFSIYELITSLDVDRNKIYLIDRGKMNNLAFVRGSSKSFVNEYDFEDTIFSKGGEK